RIAQGELSEPVAHAGARHELLSALDGFRERTFRVVSDVRARTLAIATQSGLISSDQAVFASMVRAQSDALDSTASSLEELTAAVEQSAHNAARGHQIASSTL